ncbi:hypothetical protein SELMODRAFT_413686 [Selaginella moellendorffii]|uniref:CHORD domain-containing protein n=1 Tax=Selaginella moellendorffii TaxID=88036 RepID=D8RPW5_SELML|nr:hypothetical protein SELMODRAFT_413686 [Selaginella moellendorffii]
MEMVKKCAETSHFHLCNVAKMAEQQWACCNVHVKEFDEFLKIPQIRDVLSINNHLSASTGSRISTRRQQDLVALKLYSSFPAEQIIRFSSARRSNIIARSRSDVSAFLIRIPALILGIIEKERQIIHKVEGINVAFLLLHAIVHYCTDQLDDAALTVSGIAEVTEKVEEFFEEVAESIPEDATREKLRDKVKATTDSMRSDIGTVIEPDVKAAADITSRAAEEAQKLKAAADITSRAAEEAQKLKDAAMELEEKHTDYRVVLASSLEGKPFTLATTKYKLPPPLPQFISLLFTHIKSVELELVLFLSTFSPLLTLTSPLPSGTKKKALEIAGVLMLLAPKIRALSMLARCLAGHYHLDLKTPIGIWRDSHREAKTIKKAVGQWDLNRCPFVLAPKAGAGAMGKAQCQRIGCDALFSPDQNDDENAFCCHPGPPLFHDGGKQWSCCKQQSHDFSLFLSIPGLNFLLVPSAVRTKSTHQRNQNQLPSQAKLYHRETRQQHQLLEMQTRFLLFRSRNKGCGKAFTERENHETACRMIAVFHDRSRGDIDTARELEQVASESADFEVSIRGLLKRRSSSLDLDSRMATASDIAFPGLRFNPLAERRGYQVLSINNHLSASAGSRISTRRQQDLALKLYSSFPAEQIFRFSSARRSNIIARASLDVLAFLIRLPALILGFIKKEQQIMEIVEGINVGFLLLHAIVHYCTDQLDDAALTVSGIAEGLEKVEEVIEDESIPEDRREELRDKVKGTTDSMRSDIGTVIDSAADPTKPKTNAGGEPDVKAAADAASRAAEKAQKLKDAATELEEKHPGSTTNAMNKSHHFRAISPSRGRSAVTLVLLSAMLSSLIVSNWPAILKHVFDFLLHHGITI